MVKFIPSAFIGVCLLATGGCASLADAIPQTVDPELLDSPFYPGGYSDGCTSALEADKKFSTKVKQDDYLFREEKGYAYGWRQGFAECTTRDSLSDSGSLRTQQDPYQ